MKLVVTIPAFNEEKTIAEVINGIPKKIDGISKIQVVVVDDGSTDKTSEIAAKNGASVVVHKKNLGLGITFKHGLEKAIDLDADVIVNTDADNQYDQSEIPKLVSLITEKKADVVLGSRFEGFIEEMPIGKKLGNKVATFVVNLVSNANVSDAQTGFRAFSREAALKMNIQSNYTYTQETIIQAVFKNLKVAEVPVKFRKRNGKSRLISSIWSYALKAGSTILRTYLAFKPLKFFGGLGILFVLIGFATGLKVLVHYTETGLVSPFIPTALLSSALIIIGIQLIVMGLAAETIKFNRLLIEEVLYESKKK